VKEERKDFGATPRLVIRITVPAGIAAGDVKMNIKHALWTTWKQNEQNGLRLGAIGLFAYHPGDDYEFAFTVGRADFGPDGTWENADPKVPIGQWKATIELSSTE